MPLAWGVCVLDIRILKSASGVLKYSQVYRPLTYVMQKSKRDEQ